MRQYKAVRFGLANIYASDSTQLGPSSVQCNPLLNKREEELADEEKIEKQRVRKQQEMEKTLIKKGYTRVHKS